MPGGWVCGNGGGVTLLLTVYSGVLLFSARHLANIINVRLRTVHSRDRHSIYRARARYLFQWILLDTVHTNTRTVHITVHFRQRRLMLKDEFNNFSICKVKRPGGAFDVG